MRSFRWLLLAVLVLGLTTCKGDGAPAGPGALKVRLASPNADDGGVIFVIRGGPIDSVQSAFADVFTRRLGPSEFRVIVAGSVAGAVVATVWVPDLDAAAQYLASIEQVASGTTHAQRATDGYTLTVAKP